MTNEGIDKDNYNITSLHDLYLYVYYIFVLYNIVSINGYNNITYVNFKIKLLMYLP